MSLFKVGAQAPDFSLVDDAGKTVSLKDFRGKKVVLYFYPKDDTPGCTVQACEFRDFKKEFGKKDAVVLGVSRDGTASHQKFKEKYSLNFPLLSDEDHKVHELYGAWGEKTLYGKTSMGAIRTTVVIDGEGKMVSWEGKVRAEGNAGKALETL